MVRELVAMMKPKLARDAETSAVVHVGRRFMIGPRSDSLNRTAFA